MVLLHLQIKRDKAKRIPISHKGKPLSLHMVGWKYPGEPMIGENRQLVTNELIEFEK